MLEYLNDLLAKHGLGSKYLRRRTGHNSVTELCFDEVRDLLCTLRSRRKSGVSRDRNLNELTV
jgi:hypothetical protein